MKTHTHTHTKLPNPFLQTSCHALCQSYYHVAQHFPFKILIPIPNLSVSLYVTQCPFFIVHAFDVANMLWFKIIRTGKKKKKSRTEKHTYRSSKYQKKHVMNACNCRWKEYQEYEMLAAGLIGYILRY